jgi:hypothetical protein
MGFIILFILLCCCILLYQKLPQYGKKIMVWFLFSPLILGILFLLFVLSDNTKPTNEICEANSHLMTDDKCDCDAGYVLDSTSLSCITTKDEETILLNRLSGIAKTAKENN